MTQPANMPNESPSQTAGPYVHIGCTPSFTGLAVYEDLGAQMITGPAKGQQIEIRGQVFDGDDVPLLDAMVEIWQADTNGLFHSANEKRGQADPHFTGWGRCPSNMETGAFAFETIKPGQVPWSDGRMQAPHITVWIVARGINIGLQTRIYFADEPDANATDPILSSIQDQDRVPTLLAKRDADGIYQFDVRLQGADETIFFDI